MKIVKIGAMPCLLAMLALGASGASAQGLQNPEAIETIIGTEVREGETAAEADSGKVIEAIEATVENTSAVRKLTNLDRLEIVYLPDAAPAEGGPPRAIAEKIEERKDEIAGLRKEIEGNAMLYHAIDSRQVLIRDVLGIAFDDGNGVTIYAAAKPPQQ